MATGLIALLDDVAAIAKVAASTLDDVAAASAKAGTKAAGVVIDDAAVTPSYVTGFTPDRELPMIWKIAKGSLKNKLLILLPLFVALVALLPWALTPILMVGGAYLCFEAAEKVMEKLGFHHDSHQDVPVVLDPTARESEMVSGAIRTDLILSAEILAISLGTLTGMSIYLQAAALAGVSLAVTIGVYGAVAFIVKMDDIGVRLARYSNGFAQTLGRGLVNAMPVVMKLLSTVGTAAMAWVGGGIIVHGMEELNIFPWLPHLFHDLGASAGAMLPFASGAVEWIVHALLSGLLGLGLGLLIAAIWGLIQKKTQRQPAH